MDFFSQKKFSLPFSPPPCGLRQFSCLCPPLGGPPPPPPPQPPPPPPCPEKRGRKEAVPFPYLPPLSDPRPTRGTDRPTDRLHLHLFPPRLLFMHEERSYPPLRQLREGGLALVRQLPQPPRRFNLVGWSGKRPPLVMEGMGKQGGERPAFWTGG